MSFISYSCHHISQLDGSHQNFTWPIELEIMVVPLHPPLG
jgi:hypothetical protein